MFKETKQIFVFIKRKPIATDNDAYALLLRQLNEEIAKSV